MFTTNSDHYRYLNDCVDKGPKYTIIATYGIYAGITFSGADSCEWGEKYQLNTRDLLDKLVNIDNVRMLVGVADYKSCGGKKYCCDCEIQYIKSLLRVVAHADMFPDLEWQMTTKLHLKCALFFYDDDCNPKNAAGVAGGRNFTDSSWADITFALEAPQIQTLYDYTHEIWEESLPVNDKTVQSILAKQGISDKSMRKLTNG